MDNTSQPYFSFCPCRKCLTPLSSSDWSSMEEDDGKSAVADQKRVTFKTKPPKIVISSLSNTAPLERKRKRGTSPDVGKKPAAKVTRRGSSVSSGSSSSDEESSEDDEDTSVLTQSTKKSDVPQLPRIKSSGKPQLPAAKKGERSTRSVAEPRESSLNGLQVNPECLNMVGSQTRQRAAKQVAKMAMLVFSSDSETDSELDKVPPPPVKKRAKKTVSSQKMMTRGNKTSKTSQEEVGTSRKMTLDRAPSHRGANSASEHGVVSDADSDFPESTQPSSRHVTEMDTTVLESSSQEQFPAHKEKSMTG